jgi:hypothetical protein
MPAEQEQQEQRNGQADAKGQYTHHSLMTTLSAAIPSQQVSSCYLDHARTRTRTANQYRAWALVLSVG